MGSFADQISKTEIPEAPADWKYEGQPRVRWANGEKSKHASLPDVPGRFYVSEKTLGGYVPGEPWVGVTRYEGEVGYEADQLSLVIIASKSQPFRDVRDGRGKWISREWQAVWQQGLSESLMTEYLCLMDGFYDPQEPQYAIPVLFCVKGMVGKRMKELVSVYREDLLAEAAKVASVGKKERVKLPLWTFRVPIGPELDKKKKPAFTDTGYGSTVQLPALYLPAEITQEVMDRQYVGDGLLQHGRLLYESFDEWRTTLNVTGDAGSKADEGQQGSAAASNGAQGGPTFPQRTLSFAKNGAADGATNGMSIEEEFDAMDDAELKRQQLGFARRRMAALDKLEWGVEEREAQEAQIIGREFGGFRDLSAREQFMIVRQEERYASGQDPVDVPF